MMKLDELKEEAEKVISWTGRFFPRINMERFSLVLDRARQYPEVHKALLETMAEYGILSYSPDGNYFVRVRGQDFSLNPELDGKRLYFVSGKHCESFLRSIKIDGLETVATGKFVVPDEISSRDWGTIRLKSQHLLSDVAKQLLTRQVLTKESIGSYSVVFQEPDKKPKVLNITDASSGKTYFFREQHIARTYSRAFPQPMEVVESI